MKTRVLVTNVNGRTSNPWVGRTGIAVTSHPYPGIDDYMVSVVIDGLDLLFKLSELKILGVIDEEEGQNKA
jgi:hypothetical protein